MSEKYDDFSREELIEEILKLEADFNKKKFGLYFDRKSASEQIVQECLNKIPILIRECDLDIRNGLQENIIVEGDNFHVLTALSMICPSEGMIDIICIDPPYNTGNDGFTFRDGFKHSEWLSFMERRLLLAKELLTENGVIFINIDDNEYANLKLLCDSIFGNENYVSSFVWLNNLKGRQISNGGAVKTYEHILLYSKNSELLDTFEGDIRELSKEMPLIYKDKNYEVLTDDLGKYIVKNELHNTNSAFNEETRPNLVFDIFYDEKRGDVLFGDVDDDETLSQLNSDYVKIKPHRNSNGIHLYHAWRWSRDKIKNELHNLHFEKVGDTYKVFTKLRDIYSTNLKDVLSDSTNGNSEVNDIIGKDKFSFPKPVKLIKRLIKSYVKKELDTVTGELVKSEKPVIILDFFAGSGTTGQAVLELNEEDDTNRKFILNTLNEVSDAVLVKHLREKGILSKKSTKKQLSEYKATDEFLLFVKTDEYKDLGICRSVTRERLVRITSGTAIKGKYANRSLATNVRYYFADFIEDSPSKDQSKYNLVEKCNDMLCILEDTYDMVDNSDSYYVYENRPAEKCMSIFFDYFNKTQFDKMITKIKDNTAKEKVIYLFSLNNEIDSNEERIILENIPNANIKPIPSKMYEIYKKIVDDLKRNY